MSLLRIGTLSLKDNLVLAPMAGITDSCFRRVVKRQGAGLVSTEMISAVGLVRRSAQTYRGIKRHPEEGHVSVQIFGSDPTELAEAARIAEGQGASLIDLNLGCPAKRVCSSGAGAALLLDPRRVRRIFQSVRKAISCPLTAKIRSGWDETHINAPEIARVAEENGVDAVVLHPRTRSQGFRGRADWNLVLRLKEERGIPIIGNGDMCHPHEAEEALRRTGCDGIMVGRAARGDPWLFPRIRTYLESGVLIPAPSHRERMDTMLFHLETALEEYGAEAGTRRMHHQLSWYVRGLPMSRWFRVNVHKGHDPSSLRTLIKEYFEASTTLHPSV